MTAVFVLLKADTSEDPPISPRTEPEWSIRIADRPSNTGKFLQEMVMAFSNASLLTVCNKPAPVTHDKNSSGDINTYIIKDSSSGLFKIGKSRNPIERLKTLSIGNPNLSIIGVCNKNVELLIHKEYDSVRVDGEWFRMDNNDICHIIKKYGFICVE